MDSTYTGIPLVNISLTFFAADGEEFPAVVDPPTVLPVTNSPGNWDALAVTAGSNLTYAVTLPYNDVVGARLELMASAHGCEEFWYTNIDDDEAASEFGLCGGGVYREIQVYVDGLLAGATYPFPVMYTGGINPFLWRPLTGIMSFDIPAYSFDLTPFVLGDGRAHNVTVKVLGGDAEGGVWYLDATLLLHRDAAAAPVSGGVASHFDSGSAVRSNSSRTAAGGYGWDTEGTHSYLVTGQVTTRGGSGPVLDARVGGVLRAWNTNALSDSASVQTTDGELTAEHTYTDSDGASSAAPAATASTAAVGKVVRARSFYPYAIVSSYKQDATTFDMRAQINMSYQRANTYYTASPPPKTTPENDNLRKGGGGHAEQPQLPPASYTISWANYQASDAAYNRTLDHTVVYVESDTAAARYFISSNSDSASDDESARGRQKDCYQRVAQAADGYVLSDQQEGQCALPGGRYVCGYELCRNRGDTGDDNKSVVAVREMKGLPFPKSGVIITPAAYNNSTAQRSGEPLVRHPLMGKQKIMSLLGV